MTGVLAGGALVMLVALLVGLLIDQHARHAAWHEIAVARRRNWEQWRLLRTAGDLDGCPNCGFMRSEAEDFARNERRKSDGHLPQPGAVPGSDRPGAQS
ncbi:MAG: hypothetical protein ACRDRG_16605 [Pseudonocardiaceae bacterium]